MKSLRHSSPRQEQLLTSRIKALREQLEAMSTGEKPFLAAYQSARLHAFEIEFLAKFWRKASAGNREHFENLNALAKNIEDRLGEFNEIDEMIGFTKGKDMVLPSGEAATDHFLKERKDAYHDLSAWMKRNGWLGPKELSALAEMQTWVAQMEWLNDVELRAYAGKKMAKTLRELQELADEGAFDARKKSGYQLAEVEPRVHEARREIRKIAMYANYSKGLFALTHKPTPPLKRSWEYFAELARSPVAKSKYSQLPPKSIRDPLLLPFPFFVAVTKYVSELGAAKDWAQNLERLRHAGLPGEICLDQLDPALKDVFGCPTPFNALVTRNLNEIRATQLFRLSADFLETQI